MTSSPGTARERYATLLWRLSSSSQWERSLAVARDWLAEEPDSVDAHQHAAHALVNLERYPEAYEHARKALTGDPHRPFLHRLASVACFGRSDQRGADHHVAEAIRLNPHDAMNWYHLARMRYRFGAHEAAARHARHALELAPHNADIVNLLALCEGADPAQRYARYQHALALDPENAIVHNNLGVHHLNVDRDADAAAGWFRRALLHDPADRDAQRNLILALRLRDPFYRFLQFPRRFIGGFGMSRAHGWSGNAGRLLLLMYCGNVVLLVYGLWLLFGLPFFKGYEALTLPDIREQAGVVGARRGGVFGFWRWPRAVRVALLVVGYAAVCAGGYWLAVRWVPGGSAAVWHSLLIAGFATAVLVLVSRALYRWSKQLRRWYVTRRGERQLHRAAPPVPR